MTSVLEPRASHADVVGGALAVNLEEDESVRDVLPVPPVKRLQKLEAITAERVILGG